MPAHDRRRRQLIALALAGLALIAYPVLRPWTDETTLEGARAIASTEWIASHTFAMLGFVLLAWAAPVFVGMTERVGGTRWVPGLVLVGAGCVLPYYGAEAFGLHAIAQRVVDSGDLGLLPLTDAVRYQPVAISLFGVGLVLLAAAGVLIALGLWRAGGLLRWGGLALAAGLVLFLPQFYAPAPLRVLHGIVLGLGCLTVAVAGWRRVPSHGVAAELAPAAGR